MQRIDAVHRCMQCIHAAYSCRGWMQCSRSQRNVHVGYLRSLLAVWCIDAVYVVMQRTLCSVLIRSVLISVLMFMRCIHAG